MSGADPTVETLRWLHYAQEDLRTGERLLADRDSPPRHACWLAQQSAEKALKAILVFLQIDFPKTHDLNALRLLVPEGWNVNVPNPELAALTEWAVEARYPGGWDEATPEDARRAVHRAREIWEMVTAEFLRRGVHGADA
jgi:HEPN domain-containing protein